MGMRRFRLGAAWSAFLFALAVTLAGEAFSQAEPAPQIDPEAVKQQESEYQKKLAEETQKIDRSFVIQNPVENQVAPLTAPCQKMLYSIYSACAVAPVTSRCEGLMKRFERNCVIPPPKDKEKDKK